MNSPRRLRKNQSIDITDLYALKLSPLWRALKAEHLSFWMLCSYFFIEYVRPQSLYPVLDILPWGLMCLLATLITAFMDPSVRWVSNTQNKLLIFFTLIIILSGIFAFRPDLALGYATVFGGWFFVYFLVITIVNTEQRLVLFLLAYCLFSFKMAQHGAVVWTGRGFSFADYGINGAPGWFRNSGEYAIQMLIYGTLSISLVYAFKEHWGRNKKWFFYAASATGYMAIMGASSRGSQLGLLVIGAWWLLKLKGGFKALIGVMFVAALLFFLLPDEQMKRFEEMGNDVSSLQRLAYWNYAMDYVIPDNPILGLGYHNWYEYMRFAEFDGIGPMKIVQEVHNIYLQAASELGLVGLGVFLIMAIVAFVANARTRSMAKILDSKLFHYLAYGLDAGLIGYLVAGMFVTVLYYPFFWVQIAMIVAVNSVARGLVEQREGVVKMKRAMSITRQRGTM